MDIDFLSIRYTVVKKYFKENDKTVQFNQAPFYQSTAAACIGRRQLLKKSRNIFFPKTYSMLSAEGTISVFIIYLIQRKVCDRVYMKNLEYISLNAI